MIYGDLQLFDILIFAGITIFLFFRLKNVLGKRNGHEKQNNTNISHTIEEQADSNQNTIPDLQTNFSKLETAYKNIKDFNHKNFLEGAKMAFETIINAFNNGDKKTLKNLVTTEVFKSFEGAIDSSKIDSDWQFYSLNIESVESVIIDSKNIKISINFISEQFKNNDENTIIKKQDLWTFEKAIKSKEPKWLLSAT